MKTLRQITKDYEESPAGAQRIAGLKRTLDHIARTKTATVKIPESGSVLRFAITGDRHHGNVCCDVSGLRAFYAECARQGITRVLDAGDMLDGHGVYRGQEFELKDVGFDAQAKAFARESPDHPDITTHFITGNHDASFTRKVGVSVGDKLHELRPDYVFEGQDIAIVELTNNSGTKCRIQLIHPDGGSSYAISYRLQKIIEQLEGGSKPDVLACGHYHKAHWIPQYRNIVGLETGTFERQTPFMARNGLAAHVGGWIIEFAQSKGSYRIKAEFIAFL